MMNKGIVAAGHPATAEAGADMLRCGGNAVDAAVAAAFTSFVAEPTLVSPGGGGFALMAGPLAPDPVIYDFFCSFPGLGQETPVETDFITTTVDFGPTSQNFHIGRASVAVPGNVAGLVRLQAEHGKMPLRDVLQPAIRLARYGVTLGDFGCYVGHLLRPIFLYDAQVAALFGGPDSFLPYDFVYRNPELADTLDTLSREGADWFYKGDFARELVRDQQNNGGLITEADLQAYQVEVRKALHLPYRDYELLTNPPPSRGGALIAFSLAMLAAFDLHTLRFGRPRHLGLLAEVMRQTNLARPVFEESLSAEEFLSPEFVQRHRNDLGARLARHARPYPPDPPPAASHNNTTHISVMDAKGNFVALTTTSGETSGYAVPGTGFILNNILGEDDLHPLGFHKGVPGRRIGSMMAPTILLRDGKPMLALGSGGSNRLRTAILQVISNVCDFGMELPVAVQAPRIHYEFGQLQAEGGIMPYSLDTLRRWGYDVVAWEGLHMFFGGVHAVGLDSRWRMVGAGDPRRAGTVARA